MSLLVTPSFTHPELYLHQFIYLITLTEVSSFVKDLALEQEAIVTKPIKALSLYNATKNLDARSNSMSTKQAKKTSAMDSSYAKVSRTFGELW